MKQFFSGALALLLCAGAASANDAAFIGVPGSPTLLQGEHPQIRMESERVILTANPKNFETSATFVFVNDSARRVSVQMGFPESNSGDIASDGELQKTGFERFATFVSGQKVAARRVILSEKEEQKALFGAWWLKTVEFAPRERKTVRVETASPYGGMASWGFGRSLSYHFTGANWKGRVSRSDLEVRVAQPALWSAAGLAYTGNQGAYFRPAVEVKNGVATLRKSWTNWQAQSAVFVGLWQSVPFWMMETASGPVAGDVLANTVTFRTGGEAGKLGKNLGFAPQAFTHNNTTFVQLSHLDRRLSEFADELNSRDPQRVSTKWNAQDKSTRFEAGPVVLTLAPNRKTMNVERFGGETRQTVTLPAAPIVLESGYGYNSLYVPLAPVAKALGITFKTAPEKRHFTISRGHWPASP